MPLLIAMERGTPAERELIRHAIEHGEVQRPAEIVDIVRRTGALDATRDAARSRGRPGAQLPARAAAVGGTGRLC